MCKNYLKEFIHAEKQEDFSKNDLWNYLMDDKESEENLIYLIKH